MNDRNPRSMLARLRSLWRGTRLPAEVDASQMDEEFRHHMELRAADLVTAGMTPDEARRQARLEFGSTESYKDKGREARGLRHFDALRVSWLDIKLGARMVAKYPGLSVVGVVGMGVAIAIGAGLLTAIAQVTSPALPLDEGDRVIGIEVTDAEASRPERRIVHDFERWRRDMRTVEDLGATRGDGVMRNLITADGRAETIRTTEMSAAGFRLGRVNPLLGRYLVEDDEKPGAPPVVVIGYLAWRNRFGSDPGVVGQAVQLGPVKYTVVGVMPEGFGFPINYDTGMWIPLRLNALSHKLREGPAIYVFGRLAPGVTLEDARSELATIGQRMATESPHTHARLRPRLMPYTQSWFELDHPDVIAAVYAAQFAITLLLVVICGHVAILVYARTATRHSEIAVRTALGASRSRIVTQLFGESLVLSALAAAFGVFLLQLVFWQATAWVQREMPSGLPFWISLGVSPRTLAYVAGLALLGAVVVGVLPALQATGRRVHLSLQRLSGGHASVRLGRVWTALIIAEVAVTVAILPAAAAYSSRSVRAALTGPGFAAEEFLVADLFMERDASMGTDSTYPRRFLARYAELHTEVLDRLKAEPRVAELTWGTSTPGSESSTHFDLDGPLGASLAARYARDQKAFSLRGIQVNRDSTAWLRTNYVDVGFFDVFDVPLVAGRMFGRSDADSTTRTAIVNRAFVDLVLGAGNPIGRQIRRHDTTHALPWYQIVGVVENFPASDGGMPASPRIYLPAAIGQHYPANVLVRMRSGDPATLSGALRATALDIAPTLHWRFVRRLDDAYRSNQFGDRALALVLGVLTLSVLLLSTAGVYALMSVIVTKRRREIGIRMALGADRRRILTSLFSTAAMQLAAGIIIGLAASSFIDRSSGGSVMLGGEKLVLPAIAVFMMLVGLLATTGPARRGFRIQPTEALKAE